MTTHRSPLDSVLETVGETPLVRLQAALADVDVYAKLESFNPGGSVKDRIGMTIVRGLLDRGALESHADVAEVHYSGLASHPGHDLAAEQVDDFGGMLSFELDGTLEQASALVESMEVFALAESLGGVESLVEQPAAMTHAAIPAGERREAGLSDGLIRVSVGVEHVADRQTDLERAIDAALA